jgi:hypothetical protein
MMRKAISRFTSSFAALLSDQTTVIDADSRIENIRTAMLDALSDAEHHPIPGASKVWGDIARAGDVQTLWYLRSDVLRALSDQHGERAARHQLDVMTELFRGIVPHNQMPVQRRMHR